MAVEQFLAHKRALGRKYQTEGEELRLLVRYAADALRSRLDDLTPVLLDDFLCVPTPRTAAELQRLLGGWRVCWTGP